jgi:hypothetical protein
MNMRQDAKHKYYIQPNPSKAVTLGTRNWWLYKTDGRLEQIVSTGNVLEGQKQTGHII